MKMMVNNQQEEDFFLSHLKPGMRVLEYGSGHSTLAIAPLVREVISMEHNMNWYREVKDKVPSNVKIYYIPPDSEPTAEYDDGTHEDFKQYVNFPVSLCDKEKFDVIFIDGRARVACASICHKMAHENTIIFIHDFNHPDRKYLRHEYFEAEKYLERIDGVFTMYKFKLK